MFTTHPYFNMGLIMPERMYQGGFWHISRTEKKALQTNDRDSNASREPIPHNLHLSQLPASGAFFFRPDMPTNMPATVYKWPQCTTQQPR